MSFTVTFPTPFSAVPRVLLSTSHYGYKHATTTDPMEFNIVPSNITATSKNVIFICFLF